MPQLAPLDRCAALMGKHVNQSNPIEALSASFWSAGAFGGDSDDCKLYGEYSSGAMPHIDTGTATAHAKSTTVPDLAQLTHPLALK